MLQATEAMELNFHKKDEPILIEKKATKEVQNPSFTVIMPKKRLILKNDRRITCFFRTPSDKKVPITAIVGLKPNKKLGGIIPLAELQKAVNEGMLSSLKDIRRLKVLRDSCIKVARAQYFNFYKRPKNTELYVLKSKMGEAISGKPEHRGKVASVVQD